MVNCSTCGAQVRKTTIVHVLKGRVLRRARVCTKCASATVRLYVDPSVATCKRCGEPATHCRRCDLAVSRATVVATLKKAAKHVRNLAAPLSVSLGVEHADGMRQAADLVERFHLEEWSR